MEKLLKHFITGEKNVSEYLAFCESHAETYRIDITEIKDLTHDNSWSDFSILIGNLQQKQEYFKQHQIAIHLGWIHDTIKEPASPSIYASDYNLSGCLNIEKNQLFWCIDLASCLYLLREFNVKVNSFSDYSSPTNSKSIVDYFRADLDIKHVDINGKQEELSPEELLELLPPHI